jgi:FKBP-type peptidyl-prolyl cis-trans isomerase
MSPAIAAAVAPALLASKTVAFQCPSSTSGISSFAVNNINRRVLVKDIFGFAGAMIASTFNVNAANALVEGNPPPSKVKKSSLGEEYRQGTAALADSPEAEVLPREAYNKLDSGVIYADISKGDGEVVKEGSRVNSQWVLRRSNGYFVDSSAVSDSVPFIFTVGDPQGAIAGLDEGVRGMRTGGTRRILIPPRLAYISGVDDGKPGPIPAGFGPRQQMRRVMEIRKDVPGEYIFLEVKVTKVR